MPIDYKLVANRVVDYTLKGIDYLLAGKDSKKPAYAYSFAGLGFPDPELYKTPSAKGPSIDERVRAYYSTPVPPTGLMTAKEALFKLLYML